MILPTSRVRSRSRAVGGDVDFLADVGAVEQQRVDARLPIHSVAAVARIPDVGVVSSAEQGEVVATAAEDEVVARAAGDRVIAVAAVDRQIHLTGMKPRRVDDVVASEPVYRERVNAGVNAVHIGLRRQSGDDDPRAGGCNANRIIGSRAVDVDIVRLAITRPARGRSELDEDRGDACSGKIVDRDIIFASDRRDRDLLDAVEVHRDIADVAEEPDAAAVGRDVNVLVRVGSIELQCVNAILAFDDVAAVARIPGEPVVAGPQKSDVVAAPADHAVVAVAPYERVGALTAGDRVVASAAIDRQADRFRPAKRKR